MHASFAFFGLLIVSSTALAQNDASEPVKRHTLACDGAPGAALLNAAAYSDYRSGAESGGNMFYESIALPDGAKLQIRNGGCAATEHEQFLLTVAHPEHEKSDVNYWSSYLERTLAALKTRDDGAKIVASMRGFLAKAPTYTPHDARVEVCRDGTPGNCSGGTYSLEINKAGDTLIVKAEQSS